jgi:hypothetical protein
LATRTAWPSNSIPKATRSDLQEERIREAKGWRLDFERHQERKLSYMILRTG